MEPTGKESPGAPKTSDESEETSATSRPKPIVEAGMQNRQATYDGNTIRSLCLTCVRLIEGLCDVEYSESHRYLQASLEDERGRLRVWAANIGALQDPRRPQSLEARVRSSPAMREAVMNALQRLLELGSKVLDILSGKAPNRSTTNSRDEVKPGVEYDSDMEPTTELDQLQLAIHSSISHLFSLSAVMRRARPKGRLLNLDSLDTLDSAQDVVYVEDKFPKTKGSPWLARRLGDAIFRRRAHLRYRQQHRKKLSALPGPEMTAETDDFPMVKKFESMSIAAESENVTFATTFDEQSYSTQVSDPRPRRQAESFFTTATSYLTNNMDPEGGGLQIPDLRDMKLDGVQLQYGELFECPYCRTIQSVANRYEWKKHVFSDLQPYVCIFEECSTQTFQTLREWYQHEIKLHRRRWRCNLCSNENDIFDSEASMADHITSEHGGVNESQLKMLLGAWEVHENTLDTSSCPFCSDWAPDTTLADNTKTFCRHLARHLRLLSLASIPTAIDGLEVVANSHDVDDDVATSDEDRGNDAERREEAEPPSARSSQPITTRKDIENSLKRDKGGGGEFLPNGLIGELSSYARISATLRSYSENIDDGLLCYATESARKVLLILVYSEFDNIVGKLTKLRDDKFTDDDLPVRKVEDYIYSSKMHEIREPWSCFNDWSAFERDVFCDRQWTFLALVLSRDKFDYEFEQRQPLPFVRLERATKDFIDLEFIGLGYDRVEIAGEHQDYTKLRPGDNYLAMLRTWMLPGDYYDDEYYSLHGNKEHVAKTVRQLQHPHIIETHAAFRLLYENRPAMGGLLFPLASGGSLQGLMERSEPDGDGSTVDWALTQIRGLASGIEALHGLLAQHGNINPTNLMIFSEAKFSKGRMVLGDFLYAKSQHIYTRNDSKLTFPLARRNPKYMAPEGFGQDSTRPDTFSLKSDVWSFGCVVFHFMIWLVLGRSGQEEFRRCDGFIFPGFPANNTRLTLVELHPFLESWTKRVKTALRKPGCQIPSHARSALEKLLDLVLTRLLVIDYHSRADSTEVLRKIDEICAN